MVLRAKLLSALLGVVVLAGACGSVFGARTDSTEPVAADAPTPTSTASGEPADPAVVVDEEGFYILEPDEFDQLYQSIVLPDTEYLAEPPPIFGDPEADSYIRTIAEERGYRPQRVATGTLTGLDGYQVQPALADSWAQLILAADAVGISLEVVSGVRSIDDQAFLFREGLELLGVSDPVVIGSGEADTAIDEVLAQRSVPGYSKHHSGYAIDIAQVGISYRTFGSTEGHEWMAADNYRNAKRFGFIPSYPDGAGVQGPDPEPWEFVWVGADALSTS